MQDGKRYKQERLAGQISKSLDVKFATAKGKTEYV
jgi:hypothetical protein